MWDPQWLLLALICFARLGSLVNLDGSDPGLTQLALSNRSPDLWGCHGDKMDHFCMEIVQAVIGIFRGLNGVAFS